VKLHASRKDTTHHPGDVVGLEGVGERAVTHVTPGGIDHFIVLQVVASIGEKIVVAAVIVMQVRDNDVANLVDVDAGGFEALRHRMSDRPASLRCDRFPEPSVDDERAIVVAYDPDEIVERHVVGLVRIAVDEVAACIPMQLRILDGEHFVEIGGHKASLTQKGKNTLLGARRAGRPAGLSSRLMSKR
jgi:hypothetical protein